MKFGTSVAVTAWWKRSIPCLAFLLVACGSGGGEQGNGGQSTSPKTTQTIGSAGGTITVSDASTGIAGTSLSIPRGALTGDTTITIEKGERLPGRVDRQIVVKLEPEGTKFAVPVILTMPVGALASEPNIAIFTSNQDGSQLEYRKDAVIDKPAGTGRIALNHFSITVGMTLKPLPPGTYTYTIVDRLSPQFSFKLFTAEEATAIDAEIQVGALAPYYRCRGFTFQRLPWPDGFNTADIIIVRQPIPPDSNLEVLPSGFSYLSHDTQRAFIAINPFTEFDVTVNPPVGTRELQLYSGALPVPPELFDLRTMIAHELSHWMGINSQEPSYQGLFGTNFMMGQEHRQMNAADHELFVRLYPECGIPHITVHARPDIVATNGNAILTWSTEYPVASCVASGAWSGPKSGAGTEIVAVGGEQGTRTYTLTCATLGPGGPASASTSVEVVFSPPVETGCERISHGSSTLAVKNRLPSGVEVKLPQFAFGADMMSGACELIGLEFSQESIDVEVELQQCTNSATDSGCHGRFFGPRRTRTIPIIRGSTVNFEVTSSAFAN